MGKTYINDRSPEEIIRPFESKEPRAGRERGSREVEVSDDGYVYLTLTASANVETTTIGVQGFTSNITELTPQ